MSLSPAANKYQAQHILTSAKQKYISHHHKFKDNTIPNIFINVGPTPINTFVSSSPRKLRFQRGDRLTPCGKPGGVGGRVDSLVKSKNQSLWSKQSSINHLNSNTRSDKPSSIPLTEATDYPYKLSFESCLHRNSVSQNECYPFSHRQTFGSVLNEQRMIKQKQQKEHIEKDQSLKDDKQEIISRNMSFEFQPNNVAHYLQNLKETCNQGENQKKRIYILPSVDVNVKQDDWRVRGRTMSLISGSNTPYLAKLKANSSVEEENYGSQTSKQIGNSSSNHMITIQKIQKFSQLRPHNNFEEKKNWLKNPFFATPTYSINQSQSFQSSVVRQTDNLIDFSKGKKVQMFPNQKNTLSVNVIDQFPQESEHKLNLKLKYKTEHNQTPRHQHDKISQDRPYTDSHLPEIDKEENALTFQNNVENMEELNSKVMMIDKLLACDGIQWLGMYGELERMFDRNGWGESVFGIGDNEGQQSTYRLINNCLSISLLNLGYSEAETKSIVISEVKHQFKLKQTTQNQSYLNGVERMERVQKIVEILYNSMFNGYLPAHLQIKVVIAICTKGWAVFCKAALAVVGVLMEGFGDQEDWFEKLQKVLDWV